MTRETNFGTVIILNGVAGTGSSTVAKLLQEKLGYEYVYGGGIFRKLAAEAGKTLEQAQADLVNDPQSEKAVDNFLIDRARQGNVIIESRVIAWLAGDIPSYKVWLVCDFKERQRRIAAREGTNDVFERMVFREKVDAARYQALYGIHLDDHSVYDSVIDTTNISAREVADQILKRFRTGS